MHPSPECPNITEFARRSRIGVTNFYSGSFRSAGSGSRYAGTDTRTSVRSPSTKPFALFGSGVSVVLRKLPVVLRE